MSIEGLLLLALFVLLPLIERLVEAARQRRDTAQKAVPRTQPDVPPPLPSATPGQPLSAPDAALAEAPSSPLARPAERARARRRVVEPATRPVTPRDVVIRALRSRDSLRGALVLMTVLGPCRAQTPHPSSDTM